MNKKEYFTPSVKVVYTATRERMLAGSVEGQNEDFLKIDGEYE